MGKIVINSVSPSDIGALWETVEPYIETALEASGALTSSTQIQRKLMNGKMQLYVVVREKIIGAFTTEIEQNDKGKVLRSVTVSGESFDDWIADMNDMLKAWANELGIDKIQFIGRIGWIKHKRLKSLGWKPVSVVMEI